MCMARRTRQNTWNSDFGLESLTCKKEGRDISRSQMEEETDALNLPCGGAVESRTYIMSEHESCKEKRDLSGEEGWNVG